MRAPYHPPVIQKLHAGLMNKFSGSPNIKRTARDAIDGVPVADLVARFGSPVFVFSEPMLRRRYREVRDAFTTRYPNVVFGWSYKTNYLSAICAICHQEGALAEVVLEPIETYAEKISEALFTHLRPGDFPRLILEAGRVVVDEAGYLIATVGGAKRLPDGRRAYVLDAGINLLYTTAWYKFTIEIEKEIDGLSEPTVLYGPLCMNIDVVDEGIQLPPLPRGVRLVLSPVGAYSVTQWMQFIEYRPAVVLIDEDKNVEIIREAEDLTDIQRRERLPERLKAGR